LAGSDIPENHFLWTKSLRVYLAPNFANHHFWTFSPTYVTNTLENLAFFILFYNVNSIFYTLLLSEFRLPLQVVHLLLGPHADNLARVLFPEASLEAIVVLDVAVSVLEFVQCGLEDLHRTLRW
jgi:hypothetical protein